MLVFLAEIDTPSGRKRFEAIYSRWRRKMMTVAMNRTENRDLAEEAVQEAFFAIARIIESLHGPEDPRTAAYIYITIQRKCTELLQKEGQYVPLEEEPPKAAHGERIDLTEIMGRLREDYRSVLLLRFAEGYTNREIAQLLGRTPGAVGVLISRAREALRKELEKEGYSI